ncbi:AraC family transcriptional regulator [Pseudoxanthomonas sp. PXM02]|uniref:AraC family transcriptional regulator n=1 Tax=Pseudoxanthomonas sp. PXM02 TaxID=2769294 RepID=UPI001786EA1C|nr:AraC family transcriptional regulator [Pseudoxanthomonas sp. PXM02]MBD9477886.1 AraC family transcriptional regulator [Pseudoxanthomonas sp. PXM02]
MADPLSDVVRLLHPRSVFANVISGKGNWAVRYADYGLPGFCIVLEGSALLAVDGHDPVTLRAGDFVLLPTTPPFTLSSFVPAPPVFIDPRVVPGGRGELRHGDPDGPPDMRSLGGAFLFDTKQAGLLASLLPVIVHVQGSQRLQQLVQMVGEEYEAQQPGSDYLLSRLVEMLLVEAMRWTSALDAPPGLLRGLGDERLARALTRIHADIAHAWTVAELADAAALSRSTFFDRFTRAVGVAPMEYLATWRMEVAKDLLAQGELTVAQVAERVGYGSTSAFSVAFSRRVGEPPSRYVRGR